ncbi:ATP/GTP-binding protein [Herbidospora sp. NBRC 101105]|uniref:GTP-binding protein n=1 Tax=Herbidospora sp. NBRC 101105 TaxID=3032195 RepID=UPI0024A1D3C9|nr:ATP/GTP-binding protein [Herbidospora sp. NBRC 101105]GLX92550.1 ATP-binding protein [Herbidospora sp. NBRC 101105]
MDYARSDGRSGALAIKILIAGGFGVGKTTMVSAVSEIQPLSTEELLSDRGVRVDDTSGVETKTTTTVALDFGRITLREGLWIYLFGTPGQDRFWFMWDELAIGALGAVVLADTRRLGDAFPAVDFFEQRRIPYMVAVNLFDGARRHDPAVIRRALAVPEHVPLVPCDARERESVKEVLLTLVRHAREMSRVGA